MCTVTVNIDEDLLRSVNPDLTSTAAIRKWAQQLIDCRIQEMMDVELFDISDDMSVEDLYHAIEKDVKAIYAE